MICASHPTIVDGKLLNAAYLFTPEGNVFTQDKIPLTRWEKEKWKGDAGDQLRVFDTPYGRIAILICYDIEFPELSRQVCEMGADAAEGVPNMEQIVIADVDLGKLVMNRVAGTTIPRYDKRVDVYNNDVEVVPNAGV